MYEMTRIPLVVLLCVVCLQEGFGHRHKVDQHNAIGHAMSTLFENPEHLACPGCSDLKADITEAELASLRIEFIKKQILKKLKLKEVPKVEPFHHLPLPVMAKGLHQSKMFHHQDEDLVDEDEFFGKTNQVILFPTGEGKMQCDEDSDKPTACFTFELSKDLEMDDIATADLWVFKLRDFMDDDPNVNQTLVYEEIIEWSGRRVLKQIDRHVTKVEDGWIKVDIASKVKSWLEFNERRHTIQIKCVTCGFPSHWSPISLKSDQQPFLIINTETNRKKRRPKRNINCMPGISECCREKLYISFMDIGWDWVIQPKGYDAYFCRGSCSNAVSLTVSGSGYSTVVKKLFQQAGKKMELVPCCTATHLSPLQMIYTGNNNTITQKTLPSMIVDSCGCM